MKLEVYDRRDSGNRARPGMTVTVTARGCLAFSAAAWAALGSPAYVKFLVDTSGQDRVLGFQACGTYEPEARPVNPGSRVVTARAVLRFLGHNTPGQARRYVLHMEDGTPPYIDLGETAE